MPITAQQPQQCFICPITQEIMREPYIDQEGNSYEHEAILEWLQSHNTSPITRNIIDASRLAPNRTLKELIQNFQAIQDAPLTQTTTPYRHTRLRLITVIDTSGSMSLPCTENEAEGEMMQFSRLDLVKHTLNTIIMSLTEQDEICIITFSTSATVFVPPTRMTDAQKRTIMEKICQIQPESKTNLWDGIRAAIDAIAQQQEADAIIDARRNQTTVGKTCSTEIFVLTDGEPNINPPRPMTEMVQRQIERRLTSNGYQSSVRISTFGYGYKLDSHMLYDIAASTNGTFGYIPDASMVGTVFINALARSLVLSVMGDAALPFISSSTYVVDTCNDFVKVLTRIQTVLRSGRGMSPLHELEEFVTRIEGTMLQVRQRLEAIDSGWVQTDHDAMTSDDNANQQQLLQETVLFIENLLIDCKESHDPQLGQVYKAVQPQYNKKWGQHYLLGVLSAFNNMCCLNFMDKAMQSFKTAAFVVEQERIEETFLAIPAPKPSIVNRVRSQTIPTPTMSMNCFYNTAGGCFTSDSLIISRAPDGSNGLAMAVQIGSLARDSIVLSDRGWTRVECVVRLRYRGPLYRVAKSLVLTAYHPVLLPHTPHNNTKNLDASTRRSAFPCECGTMVFENYDGYVYDLVLADRGVIACPASALDGSVVTIHDCDEMLQCDDPSIIYAATFGHTCTMEKFAHPYFGSERVVSDLKELDGTGYKERGSLTLDQYEFMRGADNIVNGLRTIQ